MTQKGRKYSKKNEPMEKFPKSLKILGGGGLGPGLENTQIKAAFFFQRLPLAFYFLAAEAIQ